MTSEDKDDRGAGGKDLAGTGARMVKQRVSSDIDGKGPIFSLDKSSLGQVNLDAAIAIYTCSHLPAAYRGFLL